MNIYRSQLHLSRLIQKQRCFHIQYIIIHIIKLKISWQWQWIQGLHLQVQVWGLWVLGCLLDLWGAPANLIFPDVLLPYLIERNLQYTPTQHISPPILPNITFLLFQLPSSSLQFTSRSFSTVLRDTTTPTMAPTKNKVGKQVAPIKSKSARRNNKIEKNKLNQSSMWIPQIVKYPVF